MMEAVLLLALICVVSTMSLSRVGFMVKSKYSTASSTVNTAPATGLGQSGGLSEQNPSDQQAQIEQRIKPEQQIPANRGAQVGQLAQRGMNAALKAGRIRR